MTLIVYKDRALHADRLCSQQYGHGRSTVLKGSKIIQPTPSFAVGVCGDFDEESTNFKERLELIQIFALKSYQNQWKYGSKMSQKSVDIFNAWLVMVSTAVTEYVHSTIKQNLICISKHQQFVLSCESELPELIEPDGIGVFHGSGCAVAMVASRADMSMKNVYKITAAHVGSVSEDFDTVLQDELKDFPVSFVDDYFTRLSTFFTFIKNHSSLYERFVQSVKCDLTKKEFELAFPHNYNKE